MDRTSLFMFTTISTKFNFRNYPLQYLYFTIILMSNQLLYNKYMTIVQPKKYKHFFNYYLYISEHSQKILLKIVETIYIQ